jgi:hypothetical protein
MAAEGLREGVELRLQGLHPWSDKLGLSIDGQTPERAQLLVKQVLAKGVIRPDLWDKTFYPDWSFGSVTYMD